MEYRLSELFDLQMGKTPSRDNPAYWDSPQYAWISIADLSSAGKYITDTKESLSALAVEESGIKVIPAQTVVMSFKLSIGKVAITPMPMYSNEAIMAFVDKGIVKIDPEYLYYLLLHRDWEEGTNKAVMGKTLNKATLSNVVISIHPYEEQREIVLVLNRVSTIIEEYKLQLRTLDQLIKARFVEMFGDPEYNNKRWPLKRLNDLCNVGSSKRIYQEEQTMEGVPFWRISDLVSKMDTGNVESILFIPESRYEELKGQGLVPEPGDILVTSRGTLGRCYIVDPSDRFYFQDGMISWLSNYSDEIMPLYIQYLFNMSGFKKQIDGLQAGSTVAYLSIAMLKKLNVMVPSRKLQEQFVSFVSQVDKSKLSIQASLDQLETLKQSLMQKYFG